MGLFGAVFVGDPGGHSPEFRPALPWGFVRARVLHYGARAPTRFLRNLWYNENI
jgi:hypothetical protein